MLARVQNENAYADRRKERDDRRRSQAQPGVGAGAGGNVVPPSPALVRHGSKQRKIPGVLTPGQLTPHSAQAQVHIPIGSNQQRNSGLQQQQLQSQGGHPYATPGVGVGYEYAQQEQYKIQQQQQQQQAYGRASPMVSSLGPGGVTPAAVSNVRARAGDVGVAQDYQGQQQVDDDVNPKPSFLKILTCRC